VNRNHWRRAGAGTCTAAAAVIVVAGLVCAPAAQAAPFADPSIGLLSGVTTGVTTVVGGVVGSSSSSSTPTPTPTSSAVLGVSAGSTTVGVSTGDGLGVGVTTANAPVVTVQLGGTVSGTAGGTVGGGTGTTASGGSTGSTGSTDGSGGTGTSGTPGATGDAGGSGTTGTPATLSALTAVAQYKTVFPAKDGYRDGVSFAVHGTTSDGQRHAASGTARLMSGSTTLTTWPITSTEQTLVWNGLKGGKVTPGRYVFTATIGDSTGASISGTDWVDVSAKKLVTTTTVLTTKAVSGKHAMAAKPRDGLSKAKVYLKITAWKVTGVTGKQYLVFSHAGKKVKVRILNGTHTSKYVAIPKSFTTFTVSHTWKKHTVKVTSFTYRYKYKHLR